MQSDKLAELKRDVASLEDENKLLANEVKTITTGTLHHKFFRKIKLMRIYRTFQAQSDANR
jgi:bacterioferritin (cytochrome b1)